MAAHGGRPHHVRGHVIGLDLATRVDFTAACVLESADVELSGDSQETAQRYVCRFLRRWPRGTSYTKIIDDVDRLVRRPPLADPLLCVDATGVGQAVVDVIREAHLPAQLKPVIITAGCDTHFENWTWRVPKRELVGVLQLLLQSGRLRIGRVPERDTLVRELQTFRVKITAALNETFESWRERDHDDLVLATALACWAGERFLKPTELPEPPGARPPLYCSPSEYRPTPAEHRGGVYPYRTPY
jgi:hypothetical protein